MTSSSVSIARIWRRDLMWCGNSRIWISQQHESKMKLRVTPSVVILSYTVYQQMCQWHLLKGVEQVFWSVELWKTNGIRFIYQDLKTNHLNRTSKQWRANRQCSSWTMPSVLATWWNRDEVWWSMPWKFINWPIGIGGGGCRRGVGEDQVLMSGYTGGDK